MFLTKPSRNKSSRETHLHACANTFQSVSPKRPRLAQQQRKRLINAIGAMRDPTCLLSSSSQLMGAKNLWSRMSRKASSCPHPNRSCNNERVFTTAATLTSAEEFQRFLPLLRLNDASRAHCAGLVMPFGDQKQKRNELQVSFVTESNVVIMVNRKCCRRIIFHTFSKQLLQHLKTIKLRSRHELCFKIK